MKVFVQPTADRRQALAGLASVAALITAKPANAAYGDSANVFGKATSTTGECQPKSSSFMIVIGSIQVYSDSVSGSSGCC